ncbi:MAG: calcium-binding protein [Synechococcaceae cyanobacterium]
MTVPNSAGGLAGSAERRSTRPLIPGAVVNDETLSFAQASSGVRFVLQEAQDRDNGEAFADFARSIEDLIGSSFDDVLSGSDDHNVIDGGAGLGNDTLEGGRGDDTVSYAAAGSGVTVSLAISGPQNTGGAGSDRLSGFENLRGSRFDDILSGDGENNELDGGEGIDTVSYSGAAARVVVSLALQGESQATEGAGEDRLRGFENLRGSAFNDVLSGDGGANAIEGGGGNDRMRGGAGLDTASYSGAAAGNDTLSGGGGADRFVVGPTPAAADADTVTDFVSGSDLLDLRAIDADPTTVTDDALVWVGLLANTGAGPAAGVELAWLNGVTTLVAADCLV